MKWPSAYDGTKTDKENNVDYARSHLRAGVNIYSGRTLALRSEKERTLNDVQKIRSGGLQTKT